MRKIIKLSSENVKRLVAVEISPDGNVVVIGGENGAGKSSVLDSIEFAMGGDPSAKMPVRRGAEKARVVLDLGDIVVKRTFTAGGGTTLVVTDADGQKMSSPQTLLDKLIGKLTFDPLEFARLASRKPKEAADILRNLVGVDFTKQDAERQQAFDDRTAINREAKSLENRIAAMPKHEDVPEKEISTAEILSQQQAAALRNEDNQKKRHRATFISSLVVSRKDDIARQSIRVAEFRKKLEEAEQELKALHEGLAQRESDEKEHKAAVASLVDEDLSVFAQKLEEVESGNKRYREAKLRAELVDQFKAKTKESETLTEKIEAIDSAKRKAAMDAKYPVEGLTLDPSGAIMFNSIPFEQCSSAEQLKVSVGVSIALNPKLKVILIRDGSLLDDNSMKTLLEMAKASDAQVWIERVGTDAQTSVVIEDGTSREPTPAEKGEPALL